MKIITTEKIPIKIWAHNIDEKALEQSCHIANLPFAFSHVAIMPDVHAGYGMPIGGVLAANSVIVPNAVGVDIGCGMCAVKTTMNHVEIETLKKILGKIREMVPLGFNHQKKAHPQAMPDAEIIPRGIAEREYESATYQVGTLGGGNHFIEIQKGSDGYVWVMIHSGSRNIGKQVADHYNNKAKQLNQRNNMLLPKGYDLAYLQTSSKEGQAYLKEMQYCLSFAKANRDYMLKIIKNIFYDQTGCDFSDEVNIHHNYAAREIHFNKEVYVHRKGATSARKGERGIIPGSQGNNSYIVRGKGNPESFMSCSHGAGRKMGRKQAIRTLDFEKECWSLNEKGILHSIRHRRDLDEAPSAYKDIQAVMEQQQDLVSIEVALTPLAVIKG